MLESTALKIKALSLSSETKHIARILRNLKKARQKQAAWVAKQAGPVKDQLESMDAQARETYLHHVKHIRPEARRTHLARMFMRGHDYYTVEIFAYSQPEWDRVFKIVKRFTPPEAGAWLQELTQQFERWRQEGRDHWLQGQKAHEAARIAKDPQRKMNLINKTLAHDEYKALSEEGKQKIRSKYA